MKAQFLVKIWPWSKPEDIYAVNITGSVPIYGDESPAVVRYFEIELPDVMPKKVEAVEITDGKS